MFVWQGGADDRSDVLTLQATHGQAKKDGEYVALVPEFPHLSALAATPQKAEREAVIVTEAALEGLVQRGVEPPELQVFSSFSGQIRVRMPRTLYQKLVRGPGWRRFL